MQARQIGSVGVARDVVFTACVVDHVNAQFRQLVHNPDHAAFIAGDGFGGKQEGITVLQFDPHIVALRQLRRGRAAFTLATCDQQHHVFTRHLQGVFRGYDRWKPFEDADFCRRFDHAPHGAAQQNDRPVGLLCGQGQRFQTCDVRRECGRDHHAGRFFHHISDRVADRGLRAPRIARENIRTVTNQCFDAIFGHFFPKRLVPRITYNGGLIDFEVTRVQNAAFGRINQQTRTFGDRVTDGQVGYCHRAAFDHLGVNTHDFDHRRRMPVFIQLAPCNVCGKGPRIDGRAQLFPVVPDSTYVVFVGVGDEDAINLRLAFLEPSNVWQDQVHTRRAIHIWKGHTKIDNDQTLFARLSVAINIGVHANFASAPKRQVNQAVGHALSLLYLWITVSPWIVRSSSNASNSGSDC